MACSDCLPKSMLHERHNSLIYLPYYTKVYLDLKGKHIAIFKMAAILCSFFQRTICNGPFTPIFFLMTYSDCVQKSMFHERHNSIAIPALLYKCISWFKRQTYRHFIFKMAAILCSFFLRTICNGPYRPIFVWRHAMTVCQSSCLIKGIIPSLYLPLLYKGIYILT